MRLFLVVLFLISFYGNPAISSSVPPPESAKEVIKHSPFEKLWDIPLSKVSAQTIKSYTKNAIKVEEIYYQSRSYKGSPVKIFGYYCYPSWKRKDLPAILIVHGGGGSAHLERSIAWAKRGYATLTIDLPGKGENRADSRSTGPDMDVSVLLRTKPDLNNNYLVHAVAAARNGISYLSQRKEVDADNIGMVGLSWGGVITLLTNGQDKRLKTAVNVFGAGYIPEGCTWQTRFDNMSQEEFNLWQSFIDPKNFLKTQHAPILFITGTNDHCYYLPTFQKSYAEVPVPKKLYIVPNLRHRFLADTQDVVWRWLDNKLKYNGSFPQLTTFPVFMKGEEKIILPVAAVAENGSITEATLHYTTGAPSRWTKRVWKSIDSYFDPEDEIFYFGIPTSLIIPEMMFYVTVKDSNNGAASTPIRSIFQVNLPDGGTSFAVSSPIKQISQHTKPLRFVGLRQISELAKIYFSKANKSYHLLGMNESAQ